jgi:hypothetical protein
MKPNDFGKKLLVEQCQKIRLSDFIRKTKEQIKESLLHASIEAEGYNIRLIESITGFGGKRLWFSCPVCNKRTGTLYMHPISQILGCRQCLNLDYRKHRYSKMVDNVI